MIPIGLSVMAICLCGLIILFPHRRAYVNVLVGVCLTGMASSIILQAELWPFSPYPMFANTQGPVLTRMRLFGVPLQAGDPEIPLVWELAAPFGEPDLAEIFQSLHASGDRSRLKRAVQDCLGRYERRRLVKAFNGPRLRAIRLYAVRWKLEPQAAHEAPLSKELLIEVETP